MIVLRFSMQEEYIIILMLSVRRLYFRIQRGRYYKTL